MTKKKKKIVFVVLLLFIFSFIPAIYLDIAFQEILPPYSIVEYESNNYSMIRTLRYHSYRDMPYIACKIKLNRFTEQYFSNRFIIL